MATGTTSRASRSDSNGNSVAPAVRPAAWPQIAAARYPAMWPPLPDSGFISGRAATEGDVHAGNAVFVLRSDGRLVGEPLPLTIPQYVIHVSDGDRWPAILVQAEGAGDQEIVGIRYLDGSLGAATIGELALHGTLPPVEAG